MSEQSDRIRAALSKSGIRRPSELSAADTTNTPNDAPPSVAVSEDALAGLLRSTNAVPEPPAAEPAEVETTLPIIAASDEERAATADYEEAEYYNEAPAAEPEEEIREEEEIWQAEETGESTEPQEPELVEEVQRYERAPVVPIGEAADSRLPKILLAIAGVVVVLAGVALYLFNGSSSQKQKPAAVSSFPLQLAVEPQGNGLMNIRWNPQSASVVDAREGRLVVTEKDQQPKVIALEAAQLKIGHVYYQSPAERLEFRLEVVDRSGAKAEESVLALSSGMAPASPSPPTAAIPAAAPASAPPAPATPVKAETTQVATAQEPPPQPQPARPAARQFTLPPQQTTPQSGPTILQDVPVDGPTASVVPPGVNLPEATTRIQAAAPPAPVKELPRPANVGGKVQRATLIKKVAPVYPPLARSTRVQGTVRFNATISKTGTVQNVQLIGGPGMLVQAATEAVKQWVYTPMLLNGQPVEVITQVEVTFSLGQ